LPTDLATRSFSERSQNLTSQLEYAMGRGDPPMSLEALVPYYNGAYFATVALKGRLGKLYPGSDGRAALQEVSQYQKMVAQFRDAIHLTIELKGQRSVS